MARVMKVFASSLERMRGLEILQLGNRGAVLEMRGRSEKEIPRL